MPCTCASGLHSKYTSLLRALFLYFFLLNNIFNIILWFAFCSFAHVLYAYAILVLDHFWNNNEFLFFFWKTFPELVFMLTRYGAGGARVLWQRWRIPHGLSLPAHAPHLPLCQARMLSILNFDVWILLFIIFIYCMVCVHSGQHHFVQKCKDFVCVRVPPLMPRIFLSVNRVCFLSLFFLLPFLLLHTHVSLCI